MQIQVQQQGKYYHICDSQQKLTAFSVKVLELTDFDQKGKQFVLSVTLPFQILRSTLSMAIIKNPLAFKKVKKTPPNKH